MKFTFKDLPIDIRFFGICFLPVVLALLAWTLHADGLFQFLRVLFSVLWFLAAFASVTYAAVGLSIQRDRSEEESINESFDEDFINIDNAAKKNPADTQKFPLGWQDAHLEHRRVALAGAEAYRWQKASRWWMLAAGCALTASLMLAVTAWQCVYGHPDLTMRKAHRHVKVDAPNAR